jgi:hypothetical protein
MHALIVPGAIGLVQSGMVHFAHSGCPCGRRDGEAPLAAHFESTFPKFLSSPTLGPSRLQSPYPNANLSKFRTPRATPPQPKFRRDGRLDSEPEPPKYLLPPSCPCDSTTSRRGTILSFPSFIVAALRVVSGRPVQELAGKWRQLGSSHATCGTRLWRTHITGLPECQEPVQLCHRPDHHGRRNRGPRHEGYH